MKETKNLIVIDSNSIIHRAYHALPPLHNQKKETVNAVYGFFSVLIKSINDFNPSYIATAFDLPKPTFRHKKFKEYKAKRAPTAVDLIPQFSLVKKGLESFNISVFEKEGFEADDIIGTIAEQASKDKNLKTIIITGDRDSLQLIDSQTNIYLLKVGIKNIDLWDVSRISKEYEKLSPKQLIDVNALKGDNSDNVPGVSGIGPKTAVSLIKEFKSIEAVYKAVDSNPEKIKSGVLEKLIKNKENAFLSKELVTIKKDVEISFNINKCAWNSYKIDEIEKFFQEMNFSSLTKRIKEKKEKYIKKENLSLF